MSRWTPLLAAVLVALALVNLYQIMTRSRPPAEPAPAAPARPLPLDDRRVIERFYEIWALAPDTIEANTWLGIETLQNPMDVWVTQEIIFEVKPDFIVETGTYKGGSAALWATILEQVNPGGRVITIDLEDFAQEARRLPIVRRKVDFLLGSSTSGPVLSQVKDRVGDGRVLVILDSDHRKSHVLEELDAYASLVDVGSYIIVQDGVINGHPLSPRSGPGPFEAVEAFLRARNDFMVDESRERLLLTYNPNGFLKRVR